MENLAIIRSMQTKEGDHGRASYHLRTGYLPQGPVRYPSLGSLVSHELGSDDAELPNFVSVMRTDYWLPVLSGPVPRAEVRAPDRGQRAASTGLRVETMLPHRYPFGQPLEVRNIQASTGLEQADSRLDLLASMESDFRSQRPGLAAESPPLGLQPGGADDAIERRRGL